MKLRALVRNLWAEPLGLTEARPPPYFRSITRLKPTPKPSCPSRPPPFPPPGQAAVGPGSAPFGGRDDAADAAMR